MSFYQEYLKKQKERKSSNEIEKNLEGIDRPVEKKFSDMQRKEEAEREAFMSRVKGENIPEPPDTKDALESNLRISVPLKPAKSDKFLIRLTVILALLALIGAISFFFYRAIQEGWGPGSIEVVREVEVKEVFVSEAIAPRSLFNYDRFEYPLITRPNEFKTHFLQYMNQEVNQEALVKVMFRDQQNPANPTFITASSFLRTFLITMPSPFNDRVDQESFNAFIHLREEGNETGFAVVVKEMDGFTGMMREWEDDAAKNINPFLSFLGKTTQPAAQTFVPTIHRRNIIRCLNYQDGFDICYATLIDSPMDIFVFATSLDTIRALIDSL